MAHFSFQRAQLIKFFDNDTTLDVGTPGIIIKEKCHTNSSRFFLFSIVTILELIACCQEHLPRFLKIVLECKYGFLESLLKATFTFTSDIT